MPILFMRREFILVIADVRGTIFILLWKSYHTLSVTSCVIFRIYSFIPRALLLSRITDSSFQRMAK